MENKLLGKLLGCAIGFFAVAVFLLPQESYSALAIGAAILALLYFAVRLLTRALTLIFDLILFGLPRLFLEAAVILWLSHLVPGISIPSYWHSFAYLLGGLAGLSAGSWIASKRRNASGECRA